MREIGKDSANCFVNEVKCAHLRGNNWCELLKANIFPVERVSNGVQKCPGFFLSLDQLRVMEFKNMIPLLVETDPMQRLNKEAIEREAKKPEVRTSPISPHYDHLPPVVAFQARREARRSFK